MAGGTEKALEPAACRRCGGGGRKGSTVNQRQDWKPIVISRAGSVLPTTPYVKLKVGDTECPLQVCQLSRSSESTHFRSFVEI